MVYIVIGVIFVSFVVWFVCHQRKLRRHAYLMQEAINNRDFSFRLSTDGMLPGERAMQEAMNRLGDTIRQQVDRSEVESWERLTRVLTHEIMNATAPVASISQSMLGRTDVKGTALEEGMRAIYAAAQHLNTFVDSYRKLSQLQQPSIETVNIAVMIRDIALLYPDILWELSVADDTIVSADPTILRQVLINIVKNAIEAGARRIAVSPLHQTSSTNTASSSFPLCVSNDGRPIAAEARQSIFVPFFTTKRSGNGIGLSLSRRMMIQQGGGLELADIPSTGFQTTFVLLFPMTNHSPKGKTTIYYW